MNFQFFRCHFNRIDVWILCGFNSYSLFLSSLTSLFSFWLLSYSFPVLYNCSLYCTASNLNRLFTFWPYLLKKLCFEKSYNPLYADNMELEIQHHTFCIESAKLVKDFPDILRWVKIDSCVGSSLVAIVNHFICEFLFQIFVRILSKKSSSMVFWFCSFWAFTQKNQNVRYLWYVGKYVFVLTNLLRLLSKSLEMVRFSEAVLPNWWSVLQMVIFVV